MPASKPEPPESSRFDRRLLAPMILGSIMNPINSSIISVALVPIAVYFGAPASDTAWLVSSLYLATAIGQPLFGKLIDTHGPRPVYLIGTSLSGVAGVIGVLAPNLGALVVARVLLGFATCAGYPASMYLIRAEQRRTRSDSSASVLTALSIATQTISVIGPTLGGMLIAVGGWRATFAVNVPLAIACLVLGWWVLPREAPLATGEHEKLDVVGVVLFGATLGSLLVFLMELDAGLYWLLVVVAACGAAFCLWELRRRQPFLDLRVFAGNPPLLVTFLRAVLASTVSYSYLYGYVQWLEDGRGLDPTTTGLLLLPTFATGIVVAAISGRRRAVRGKLVIGVLMQLAGCLLLLTVGDDMPVVALIGIALVFGIPQGIVNLAIQNSVYRQATPELIGASAGLQRTFMYMGAMISSAATGALFGHRADTAGMHELALFMAGVSLVLVVITLVDRALPRLDSSLEG